ncbi:MAG: hypothetical protein HOQ44_20575 [Nocardia sp.]|nr:hypothetical protein [Nocardia sp.]
MSAQADRLDGFGRNAHRHEAELTALRRAPDPVSNGSWPCRSRPDETGPRLGDIGAWKAASILGMHDLGDTPTTSPRFSVGRSGVTHFAPATAFDRIPALFPELTDRAISDRMNARSYASRG